MKIVVMLFSKGALRLKNQVIMVPVTRSRALNNRPDERMATYTYYRHRSGTGLILTEGPSPSPEGLGYPRISGICKTWPLLR